jgi:hypothetical protein
VCDVVISVWRGDVLVVVFIQTTTTNQQLEELSKRYEMQVKLNDLNQTDKLKALHDKYHLQLNHNKSRVDMLKDEKAALKLEFEQKRKALQALHMQNLQQKDMEYTTQVINEHQKGTKLEDVRRLWCCVRVVLWIER